MCYIDTVYHLSHRLCHVSNECFSGSGNLIPVIGFYCKLCEEFFGDLLSAQRHEGTCKRSAEAGKVCVCVCVCGSSAVYRR